MFRKIHVYGEIAGERGSEHKAFRVIEKCYRPVSRRGRLLNRNGNHAINRKPTPARKV